jgi:hypothetical protein
VLVDQGYLSGEQVLACKGTGVLPCVPKTLTVAAAIPFENLVEWDPEQEPLLQAALDGFGNAYLFGEGGVRK